MPFSYTSLNGFLSFRGDLFKMCRIYKKILHAYQGDFKILVKNGFRRNFTAQFRGIPEDHIICFFLYKRKPEDHWSCIAHLIAEDVLKSAVIEEKKFKNIECK